MDTVLSLKDVVMLVLVTFLGGGNLAMLTNIHRTMGRLEKSSDSNAHSINALWAAVNDLREKIK